jgi:SOS-response transcriptional repressor LexA
MQDFDSKLSDKQKKLLELFSKEINNSKRVEESLLLKSLIEIRRFSVNNFKNLILQNYNYHISNDTINSCITNLNFKFIREKKDGRLLSANEIYDLDTVNIKNDHFILSSSFKANLKQKIFEKFLLDSTNYSIHKFNELYNHSNWRSGFILYRKYSRKDVFRILNVPVNPVAQNVGGYLVSSDNKHCPIFSTLHKAEDISESTKYEDKFINSSIFQYMSKSNRRKSSKDVQSILGFNGSIRLPLFIKKNDDEGDDFYYMGEVDPILDKVQETKMKNDSGKQIPVVRLWLNLKTSVATSIFNYLQEQKIEKEGLSEEKRIKRPVQKELYFPSEYRIPFYNIYAAAGSFSEMQTSKEFALIDVPQKYSDERYFAVKVVGESMNRRIPNGSICIFRQPVIGSRNGKILLIENYSKHDQDLNSHFTVKTYTSSKTVTEEGWQHNSIILKPNSTDTSYKEIVITKENTEDFQFNVVGEFIGILDNSDLE